MYAIRSYYDIYLNTTDYQELEKQLNKLKDQKIKLQERIQKYPDDDDFKTDLLKVDADITEQEQKIESFKADVSRLYETFTKIEINTERLRLAKAHFDKGEFREADAILKAEEMTSDLEKLKEKDKQLDKEKEEVKKGREHVITSYSIHYTKLYEQ